MQLLPTQNGYGTLSAEKNCDAGCYERLTGQHADTGSFRSPRRGCRGMGYRSQSKAGAPERAYQGPAQPVLLAAARYPFPDQSKERSAFEGNDHGGCALACEVRGHRRSTVKKQITDTDGPAYDKLQDYNNRQLTDEIIPLYRKMLAIFTDCMWLAEPSTQRHYAALVEYVEIWNRFLDQSLPREVLQQIEHKEEALKPFYADLEQHFTSLSKRLR